jgi:hypothetical protein
MRASAAIVPVLHIKLAKIPSDGADRPKAMGGFKSGKRSLLGTHLHLHGGWLFVPRLFR